MMIARAVRWILAVTAMIAVVAHTPDRGTLAQEYVGGANVCTAPSGSANGVNPCGNLTTARSLALFGDSITAFSDQTSGNNNFLAALHQGYGTWLNIYTGYRVMRVPGTNNFGIGGDTCQNMAATRTASVLAVNPSIVVIECGTNDIAAGASCATVTAALQSMYRTFIAAGITVIRPTIFPRAGTAVFTANQANEAQCVNSHDKRFQEAANDNTYGSHRGYYLVDLNPVMTDPSQASWTINSGYLEGGAGQIHPSQIGASAMAWAMAQPINQIVPPPQSPQWSQADQYDATHNTTGNLLPNPLMAGAGGTLSNCPGTAANNTTVALQDPGATVTCVASITTLSDGRKGQTITITAGSCTGTPYVSLIMSPQSLPLSIGDTLEAVAAINVASGNSGLSGPLLKLIVVDGGTTYTMTGTLPNTGSQFPTNGWATGAGSYPEIRTSRYTIQGTVTNMWLEMDFEAMSACNGGALSAASTTTGYGIRKVITP